MKPRYTALTFLCLTLIASFAMAVSEPEFTTLKQESDFELRQYAGFIVAETFVEGDFDDAGRTGFRRVAAYIFGDNLTDEGASTKIAMTAPVTVEPAPPGEQSIPAQPVMLQSDADRWRLHFVMPAGSTLESLPKPVDERITLRQIPSHQVASIRFSGFTTRAKMQEKTEELKNWISTQGLEPVAPPQVARYDDPFTLPWNRRNEILIEVESSDH